MMMTTGTIAVITTMEVEETEGGEEMEGEEMTVMIEMEIGGEVGGGVGHQIITQEIQQI